MLRPANGDRTGAEGLQWNRADQRGLGIHPPHRAHRNPEDLQGLDLRTEVREMQSRLMSPLRPQAEASQKTPSPKLERKTVLP